MKFAASTDIATDIATGTGTGTELATQASQALNTLTSRLDFARLLDERGRLIKLKTALPDLALIAERLVLKESVAQPHGVAASSHDADFGWELSLDALSTSRHFELKQLIGEQITVSLLQPDGSYRPWHGYVFEAAQLGADGGLARYRLLMRSWLGFLALRQDCYAWQDKTAAQIFEDLFADHPQAHYELQLSRELRQRSLCIQYNETDLAFVQRIAAEEGLALRIEQLTGGAADDADQAGKARHQVVISDTEQPSSARPQLGALRFAQIHTTANVAGQKDAITAFEAARSVGPNAVTQASWNYKTLAGTAGQADTALAIGELPRLETYDGAGAYRHGSAEAAAQAAQIHLAAHELGFKTFAGQGSVRCLSAGAVFELIDHPLYGANTSAFNYSGALTASHQRPDNAFTVLAVEHHAANNLGAQAAKLLKTTELERGSYKNHFHAAPAAAPIAPRFVRKPTAPGLQLALVVGIDAQALTTDRDLRVKLQFPWQRGARPLPGGLSHDSSSPDTAGNAPGNEQSLTWVRIAWPSAGPNWGSALPPRLGTEVAVQFMDGDMDRPVIAGQLYNGQDSPPFAAGVDSGVNHPGVISGLHGHGLDGDGFNQWVIDDASGQLRMRLMSSHGNSQLNLGHLIQQGSQGAQRGAWRGSGFEVNTQGWASLRAGKGVLLSASARAGSYGSAQSTQMDAAEALAQLKGAKDLGQRLGDAAQASGALGLNSHTAGQATEKFINATDPKKQGKHPGQFKPGPDGRSQGSDPVEAFAQPIVMLDTPSTAAFATEASFMALAGQDTSLIAQSDLHQAAAHTFASVSGSTTSWFTHSGGIQAFAANGAVSLRAHTDQLQIWADQDVTVISVNDEIRIQAKSKIELVGGQSKLTLEGGNVTFACPGKFEVKSATHNFLGGGSKVAQMKRLPDTTVKLYDEAFALRDPSGALLANMAFNITAPDGIESGITANDGQTQRLSTVSAEKLKFELKWHKLRA
jgi:type VI secretion system secreted protein VgrG